ncbi:uncharacterized protein BJ171DRAFT_139116 [Polychytrium aggregatum]|uniref:uncharacterized protein n=1 Tax=Polychytrium aggregatum TaxID=110093 RepID=UPI0022FDEFEF|nr:uncharacterized protein BJ171DRAFT_139116 [Polychytrium aggregatum]KAI9203703.1 hypothetical protein BJ171DRAFT_139116 [Polychytrium aggregatum]
MSTEPKPIAAKTLIELPPDATVLVDDQGGIYYSLGPGSSTLVPVSLPVAEPISPPTSPRTLARSLSRSQSLDTLGASAPLPGQSPPSAVFSTMIARRPSALPEGSPRAVPNQAAFSPQLARSKNPSSESPRRAPPSPAASRTLDQRHRSPIASRTRPIPTRQQSPAASTGSFGSPPGLSDLLSSTTRGVPVPRQSRTASTSGSSASRSPRAPSMSRNNSVQHNQALALSSSERTQQHRHRHSVSDIPMRPLSAMSTSSHASSSLGPRSRSNSAACEHNPNEPWSRSSGSSRQRPISLLGERPSSRNPHLTHVAHARGECCSVSVRAQTNRSACETNAEGTTPSAWGVSSHRHQECDGSGRCMCAEPPGCRETSGT